MIIDSKKIKDLNEDDKELGEQHEQEEKLITEYMETGEGISIIDININENIDKKPSLLTD